MNRFTFAALLTIVAASTASGQATKGWVCKDGTIVSGSSENCATRGGVSSEVTAQKPTNAPPHTVAARCKDGTTEFSSGADTCEGHKGIAFSFPASGLSDSVRAAALRTDSLRQLARCNAKVAKGEAKAGSCGASRP